MARRRLFVLLGLALAWVSSGIATAQSDGGFSEIDWGRYTAEPIEVRLGIRIDQLTEIDQRRENFGVVGMMRLEWTDPNLAFEPESGSRRPFRVYTGQGFNDFADSHGFIAPGFVILNRQGRRNIDDSTVVVFPNGSAVFSERFTVTLQAPISTSGFTLSTPSDFSCASDFFCRVS